MTIKSLDINYCRPFLDYITKYYRCVFLVKETGQFGHADYDFIKDDMEKNRWGTSAQHIFICLKDSALVMTFHKYEDDDRIIINVANDECLAMFQLENADWYIPR
ncbi:hypothetical protein [Candidatus Puniceispirillum marinum]|uniref:Uncharacterized protein n=1 Tax=Puniceispirillum marinum (strain IMCC1322) TaxID=488538 RepID=D5BP44_PUNMI|nr:hypothetical protein [Candidatus Puniceispirillum marinum]ADE40478.1 hypothetical protein SAR116_2235 [Candidatus Puniceispirillum marinum IMCC1322]